MIFDQLQAASYKGVSFFVNSATTSVGRKQAEFNYPYTSKRTIEDIGLKPRSYKMMCVISGQGSEFFQLRDAFFAAIEDGKKGVLIHPFYGILQNMVARPIDFTEDLTSAGYVEVEVVFESSDDATNPSPLSNTLSLVQGFNSTAISGIQLFLNDNLGVNFVQNIQGAISNVTSFAGFANSVVGGFNTVSSEVNGYQSMLTDMLNNPAKFALSAAGFSYSTIQTLNGLFGVLGTPKDQTSAFQQYYNFGDTFTPVNPTTPARAEFNNNQLSLKVATQTAALANSQLSASLDTYSTVDDINNVNAILEKQFNKVIAYDLDEDVLANLSNLRAIVNNYLEEQKLTAAQVVPIYSQTIPATVLSYQYYGTTDRADEIISLNNLEDISFAGGNINVLSQ